MTRRTGSIVILTIAAVGFLLGYWPEHVRYSNVMGELRFANQQVDDLRARQRVYGLENKLLLALDRTAHKEYKEAHNLASEFFMEVSAEMARPDMTKFKSDLKEIMDKRDNIEEALGKEDQSARDLMRGVMQQLARLAGPPPAPSEPPAIISVAPKSQN